MKKMVLLILGLGLCASLFAHGGRTDSAVVILIVKQGYIIVTNK